MLCAKYSTVCTSVGGTFFRITVIRTRNPASSSVSLLKCCTDRFETPGKLKLEWPSFWCLTEHRNCFSSKVCLFGKSDIFCSWIQSTVYRKETYCYSQRFHIKRMLYERQQFFQVGNCALCMDSIFTIKFGTRTASSAVACKSFREDRSLAKTNHSINEQRPRIHLRRKVMRSCTRLI